MISFEFNFWDNLFAIVSIFIGVLVSIWIYKLSKQLSAKDKYDHEERITKEIKEIKIYSNIILANVKKYHPLRKDPVNSTYYKQGAELYTVIPEYGIQFY